MKKENQKLADEVESLQFSIMEEKDSASGLKMKIDGMKSNYEEEIADLKKQMESAPKNDLASNDALEKKIKTLEEQLSDLKKNHEQETIDLKKQLETAQKAGVTSPA